MSSVQPAENTPRKYQLMIDGKWIDAESGKTFTTPNPATGETLPKSRKPIRPTSTRLSTAARKAFEGKWSKSARGIAAACSTSCRS